MSGGPHHGRPAGTHYRHHNGTMPPLRRMHRPREGVWAAAEPACTYYKVYVVADII